MNILLTGRPEHVTPLKDAVVLLLKNTHVPELPKGLPTPPAAATTYVVYITAAQWQDVATTLADPHQSLIIKGWACHDPETESLAVFAQSVTTTLAPVETLAAHAV